MPLCRFLPSSSKTEILAGEHPFARPGRREYQVSSAHPWGKGFSDVRQRYRSTVVVRYYAFLCRSPSPTGPPLDLRV